MSRIVSLINNIQISSPESEDDFKQYFHFRWQHLRAPWGEPEGSETDDIEDQCIHLLARDNNIVIAVARLQFNSDDEAQIRYMAVSPDYRRQGIGSNIIKQLEAAAQAQHISRIVLDARENAVSFYQSLGYQISGKSYLLFDLIQHYSMIKQIN